jgi:CheY-like chemotaxis protein
MTSHVLVVEDDEDLVELVRQVLEADGHRVEIALNGRAALEALARADPLPSVILLDLTMPEMNGNEFREVQLADPRVAAVPIVLMTASGQVAEKTARLGAMGGLGKPFDMYELLRVVRSFAEQPAGLEKNLLR